MIGISYKNSAGELLARAEGEREAMLAFETDYVDGDCIIFTAEPRTHLWLQPDAAIMPGEVYLPSGTFTWRVPCGAERTPYSPGVFVAGRHIVTARVMTEAETRSRRNIACNPADLRGETDGFPHMTANVETRGEAIFAARNVIDGYRCNSGHWGWPYQSWGVGGRDDACCKIEFGREVEVDGMAIVIRADFPHDAWWSSAEVELSGGKTISFSLRKTAERQFVPLGVERVTWMRLGNLKLSPDDPGFPALTEWEIYGRDI